MYLIWLVASILNRHILGIPPTLRDWRNGFYVFLVWLLFEDLVRKFLGNNLAIYFGKDVLV